MSSTKPTYEELLHQNKKLEKELSQLKSQLTLDVHEPIDVQFQDLFDIDEIQKIQDLFSDVTGVASIITSCEGTPITKPSNFCRLCKIVIRGTEQGRKNCYYSDAEIGKQNKNGPIYQPCLSGGLWDAGSSITVGNKHIANWLIGQVKNDELDETKMLEYAKDIGADVEEFKKALEEVTVMSTEKFKKIADILFYFANEISEKGYQNFQKTQLISELQQKKEELKQAHNKASESKSQIKAIVNNIPDLVWFKDPNGVYLLCNNRFEQFFGAKENEILGKTDYDFVDKDLADFFRNNDKNAIAAGKPCVNEEEVSFASDGHKELLETIKTPLYIDNNLIGVLGIGRNILKRKKAERELIIAKENIEESEVRFKALHNASFGGIAIHDKGVILDCNHGLSILSRFSHEELIGMNGLLLIAESKRDFVMSQIQQGYEEPYEAIGLKKDGEEYPIRLEARNIPYKGRQVRVVEFRDISEQKEYEKKLLEAKSKAEESDRLKTEFFNNMSHEIRTPMNGILGFTGLLKNKDLSAVKQDYYINIIENSGIQLLKVIDDILEISKLGTKQVAVREEKICLNNLFLHLFSIFDVKAKENRIPLYFKKGLNDEQSTIYSDETKINKILSNLLENAMKFTNEGFIEFGYTLKHQKLEIFVKDTGIGINKEKQKSIFERFSQEEKDISSNFGGLGLGLSIAKENTELLGGKISVKSEKGKGATFYVSLPYKPINNKNLIIEPDSSANRKNEKQDTYTILIVEDEEINKLFVETILEEDKSMNLSLIHAINGLEAVNICKENPQINLVLLDLKMPVMNGYEAASKIKKHRPDLPIIAQTAYSTEDDRNKALSSGCDDFISKPINSEELLALVKNYLNEMNPQ